MIAYIKSKNLIGTKTRIPYNINFASAMFGYLEMGVEVKLFENWSDIKDIITEDDILVDYIDQVIFFLNKFSSYKDFENYPKELNKFYKRKIWKDTINHFSSDPELFTKGYFVKPIKEKVFTGKVIYGIKDLVGCGNQYEDYEILVSDSINLIKEWRVFIYYDYIIGIKPYIGETYIDNTDIYEFLKQVMEKFKIIKDRPNACSIDIGIVEDDNDKCYPVIVETNDCIALGSYGLDSLSYAKMISARQSQVLNRKDELKFWEEL